jgi:two-component system phosphate regulon sensor histidine kinase PhoR
MLASMDSALLVIVALLAISVPIAIWLVLDRQRTLDAIRSAIARDQTERLNGDRRSAARPADRAGRAGQRWVPYDPIAEDPGADLPTLVRRLRDRLDASELELDQQIRNASYLADVMGMGIVRLDENGDIELANAAAHALLRRPPGSLHGRSAIEAFVDARIESVISTALETGGSSGEFRLSGQDAPIVVVRARRSPVGGVWVVLEDVSELRRLQQIRTEFVDNLSHELRTPLSTVSLLAETLAREAEAAGDGVPPKMRDRIAKIEVETGHLVQMINELLDLARIEGGGPPMLLDDVDLGKVATEAADRLRLFAERQRLRLVVDVPPDVPPVRGDEARLGQVIVNLVHNALKFGRPADEDDDTSPSPRAIDGMVDEVRVTVREAGDQVLLSVEDHGVGIPKADQDRIFERFYKVDRARVRGGGTGLGLAIARHVVEQHGGRIRVESDEGRGSTFTVSLPVTSTRAAIATG